MYRKRLVSAGLLRLGTALSLSAGLLLFADAALARDGYDRTGEASWYGERYHGRTTASGALFDMNGLTAAHRGLAFGTLVRVTNLDNQRAVFVRITDRGPYARGRIIDLSRRAAELLGFAEAGTARVRVQVERETGGHDGPVFLRPPGTIFPR